MNIQATAVNALNQTYKSIVKYVMILAKLAVTALIIAQAAMMAIISSWKPVGVNAQLLMASGKSIMIKHWNVKIVNILVIPARSILTTVLLAKMAGSCLSINA